MPFQAQGATPCSLSSSDVYAIKEEVEDKSLAYPDYYTVPFHGEHVCVWGGG